MVLGSVVAHGKTLIKTVEVIGVVSHDGVASHDALQLSVISGSVVTRGLRIYSEPSHTLLLVEVDAEFVKTAAGKAWLEEIQSSKAQAVVTDSLPGARPRVSMRARPKTDNAVSVYVYGSWPDGVVDERLISYGTVGNADFHFTTSIDAADTSDPTHCCSGGSCSQMCVDCSGAFFSCCLDPYCCTIKCGFAEQCMYPPC
jgi:hypothetical protein